MVTCKGGVAFANLSPTRPGALFHPDLPRPIQARCPRSAAAATRLAFSFFMMCGTACTNYFRSSRSRQGLKRIAADSD